LKILNKKAVAKVLHDARRDTSELKCIAYRLVGVTLLKMDDLLAIRFDTFYENVFIKTFFVKFDMDKTTKMLVVRQHTIPYFIPLGDICLKFLNYDVKVFAECLSKYLNAFVNRQQQSVLLQSIDVSNFTASDSYDYLQFQLSLFKWIFHCKLIFDDLSSTTPNRVVIYRINEENRKMRFELIEKKLAVPNFSQALLEWVNSYETML